MLIWNHRKGYCFYLWSLCIRIYQGLPSGHVIQDVRWKRLPWVGLFGVFFIFFGESKVALVADALRDFCISDLQPRHLAFFPAIIARYDGFQPRS